MSKNRVAGRRAGFTLVELLVVIGIIALLISILLPALNRARQAANAVKCQANLKSIGQAFALYQTQNNGSMPFGQSWGYGSAGIVNWMSLSMNALDAKFGIGNNSIDYVAANPNSAKTRSMFFCPDVPGQSGNGATIEASHYMSNPRVIPNISDTESSASPVYNYNPGHNRPVYKAAKIKRAGEVAIIFDGSLYSPYTPYMSVPDPNLWGPGGFCAVGGPMDVWSMGYGNYWFIREDGKGAVDGGSVAGTPLNLAPIPGGTPQSDHFNTDKTTNNNNIRFRHNSNSVANALFADGHVGTFKLQANPFNADKSVKYNASLNCLRENFYVNLP